jgi:hypothetical protein
MAHEAWARRCDVLPAPSWTHPNGGLYLYGTEDSVLVSVDGETATLQFPNGATLANVPLRDLVDDSGYWKP